MKYVLAVMLHLFITTQAFALTSIYCPGNHQFIQVGMSEAQVKAACGTPTTTSKRDTPISTRVNVKQLIYTNLNKGGYFETLNPIFDQWSLSQGQEGTTLEIDIINGKVSNIRINSSTVNSLTICNGGNVNIGSSESQIYNACGSPEHVNNTFINQTLPSSQNPKVWTYQVTPYQPPIKLTFSNGKLQTIEQ